MSKGAVMYIKMALCVLGPIVSSFGVLFGAAAQNQLPPTGLAVLAALFVGLGGSVTGMIAFMSKAFSDYVEGPKRDAGNAPKTTD